MFFRNEYDFLSNFYPCTVCVNGYEFKNAEAAFQAMKCTSEKDVLLFINLSGADAKKLGRKIQLRSDWNTFRLEAMKYVLLCKFTQNPTLKQRLKDVNEPIVEHNTWGDTFWGVCNNVGHNHLGNLLTEVRNML